MSFSRRSFLLAGAAAVVAPVVSSVKAVLFTPNKQPFIGLKQWWTPKEILAAETGADGGFVVPKELVADLERMIKEFEVVIGEKRIVIDHRFTEIEKRMAKIERKSHGFPRT